MLHLPVTSPEVDDRPYARLLRQQAHKREPQLPLAQNLLRLELSEHPAACGVSAPISASDGSKATRDTYLVYALERVRAQFLDERRAQRVPVVVPEV